LNPKGELVRAATSLRPGTTLRGREDWARDFLLSAALAVLENPVVSDAGPSTRHPNANHRREFLRIGDHAATPQS
jgi:hypothetical protein